MLGTNLLHIYPWAPGPLKTLESPHVYATDSSSDRHGNFPTGRWFQLLVSGVPNHGATPINTTDHYALVANRKTTIYMSTRHTYLYKQIQG